MVVTTDDARPDIYEAYEEFNSFQIPLSAFVCTGWVYSQDFSESNDLVRAVDAIHWYEGPAVRISFGKDLCCDLSDSNRATNIDRILLESDFLGPYLEELWRKIVALIPPKSNRMFCLWSELQSLASSGVHIGSHSVTHVRLSQVSAIRRDFEIRESKRALEAKFGACTTWAYPFGTRDTCDNSTSAELQAAGYRAAFLSHSEFVSSSSDVLSLPRIAIPDGPLPLSEFKARVSGAGVSLRRLKGMGRALTHHS